MSVEMILSFFCYHEILDTFEALQKLITELESEVQVITSKRKIDYLSYD